LALVGDKVEVGVANDFAGFAVELVMLVGTCCLASAVALLRFSAACATKYKQAQVSTSSLPLS